MAMAFRGFGNGSGIIPLPGVITGYGGGTWNMDGTQATPVQTGMDIPAQPAAPAQGARWLDGGKFGTRDAIGLALGAIGDALSGQPNTANMVRQSFQQQRALKQADKQRQQSLMDKLWMAQWERANPKPANNDTINDFNWYKGLSDADKRLYHQMKPEYRQGPDGRFYRIDVADDAALTPPTFTQDDWDKAGGGGSNVTGGF